MSSLQRILLAAAFSALAFIVVHHGAAALEATVSVSVPPGAVVGTEVTVTVNVTNVVDGPVTVNFVPAAPNLELIHISGTVDVIEGVGSGTFSGALTEQGYAACLQWDSVGFNFTVTGVDENGVATTARPFQLVPCSAQFFTTFISDIVHIVRCDPNNDELVFPNNAPPITIYPGEWSGGSRTVTIEPMNGNVFAPGTVTSKTFIDSGAPCAPGNPDIMVTPLGPLDVTQLCGGEFLQQNDIVTLVPQEGVVVDRTYWQNQDFNIIVVPDDGYAFPVGATTQFRHLDSSIRCEPAQLYVDEESTVLLGVKPGDQVQIPLTLTLPATHPFTSGSIEINLGGGSLASLEYSPTITVGGAFALSVPYTVPDSFAQACVNGFISFDAGADLTGRNSDFGSYIDSPTDEGSLPCSALTSVTPHAELIEQAEVCGPNNDIFTTTQEGVVLTLGEWDENSMTITFAPAEGYYFPQGTEVTHTVTDQASACYEPSISVVPNVSDPFVNIRLGETVVPVTVTLDPRSGDESRVMFMHINVYLDGYVFNYHYIFLPEDQTWPTQQEYNLQLDGTVFNHICDDGVISMQASARIDLYSEQRVTVDSVPVDYPCNVLFPVTPDFDLVVVTDVCGASNDDISFAQEGVTFTLGEWDENSRTITFAPAEGYYLPQGTEDSHTVTDQGIICMIEGEFPVFTHIEVCGYGNDSMDWDGTLPPEGAWIDTSEAWVDGVFRIWVSALPGYELPEGTQTLYEFVDAGPCPVEGLVAPTHTAVCGVNNDVVNVPPVPDGVTITDPGEWSAEGTWSISYVVEDEDYRLPDGMQAEYVFVDAGPCLATPVPPTTIAICGPDNDEIELAGNQPEGVDPDADISAWSNGEATVTYSALDGYAFPQGASTSFTFTDENIPCEEPEPIGKQLTVMFVISDGGSIAGTPYQLFAPMASLVAAAPYVEGEVAAGNQIVFADLIAGEYRLVLSPQGYEPVDTTITVTDGDDEQEITIEVAALQVPVTPTPSPTTEPSPTPSATAEPTTTPTPTDRTATTAPVSGLPETGSGANSGSPVALFLAGLAAAMVLMVLGSTRRGLNR